MLFKNSEGFWLKYLVRFTQKIPDIMKNNLRKIIKDTFGKNNLALFEKDTDGFWKKNPDELSQKKILVDSFITRSYHLYTNFLRKILKYASKNSERFFQKSQKSS